MSGAEALAVIGIISNVLQLADFCSRVTDRAAEFAGRTAELPGSFSDLGVVLAVVRVNMRKLDRRLRDSNPDEETVRVLKDLVTVIEREIRIVQSHLEKFPPVGSSWAKVTLKAIVTMFNEGKIKKATDSILQNVDLLSQTVTASLPTADEIANAINEKSNINGINRKLSVILDRMKSKAINRAKTNSEIFDSQTQENRSGNGQSMQIKGATQINNMYITLNVPYKEIGKQIDQNGGMLMLPNQNFPFLPLKHALSNPNLSAMIEEEQAPAEAVIAAAVHDLDISQPLDVSDLSHRPRAARSNTTKTYRHSSSKSEIISSTSTDIYNLDGSTVVGSTAPSQVGLPWNPPSIPQQPRSPRHMSDPSIHPPRLRQQPPPIAPAYHLHNTIFELPTQANNPQTPNSAFDTISEVGTASDVWSETLIDTSNPSSNPSNHPSNTPHPTPSVFTTSSVSSTSPPTEDYPAIATVNAYLRHGASSVTKNPSEAKRAYLSALNSARPIITYSASFAVRKYRALTVAAIGLALCTQDRERYLFKARKYNEQALSAALACAPRQGIGLELRVRLDEADLQMKEARMQEKAGRDATMKVFTAYGAYQSVASRMSETVASRLRRGSAGSMGEDGRARGGVGGVGGRRGSDVGDFNTHALAMIGSGKAAAQLARSGGRFNSAHGAILSPKAYYELALAACKMGTEVAAREAKVAEAEGDPEWARRPAEDLALLKETEEGVLRLLSAV